MTADSLHFAGVVLITVPAIAFGGARLLSAIFQREPGYLDNPVCQNLWRAGHAHAGVLVILTLVGCCSWIRRISRAGCDGSSATRWSPRRS
jgi:hypothetical protein